MSDAQPSFLLSRGCQRATVAISPRRGFQLTLSKHLINKSYIYGSN